MDRSTAPKLNPDTPFLNDPGATSLIGAIEAAGHSAFFVGGCVRNAVMGSPASDVDISTDALPDETMQIATKAGFHAIPTGIDHGTLTVVVDGAPYEITTFRRDVATDGRRAVVAFSKDMAEDARRRDFTMNALYADKDGTIHDPLGGLADALAKRVRFIEDAGQRIREDYLRTLRYFRFHAHYADADAGWDADALDGIATNLEGLDSLSAERVGSEMVKLLSAKQPASALAVMEQTGVLQRILPGATTLFVGPLVHLEDAAEIPPDPISRLAALGGEDVATRLRLSRKDQKRLNLIREHSVGGLPAKALGYEAGEQAGLGALLLRNAMANTPLSRSDALDVIEGATAKIPFHAKDLPGLTGAELGARLKVLKTAWLASNLTKTKNDLLGP